MTKKIGILLICVTDEMYRICDSVGEFFEVYQLITWCFIILLM